MIGRERIKCALKHEEPDRVPIHDSPWVSTIERWENEGMPKDVSVVDFFGYEMTWIQPDITPQYPFELIDEDEEYIVTKNSFGETIRDHKNHSTTPQIIDSPVKSREDWEELKERLTVGKSRLITYNPVKPSIMSWDETMEQFNDGYKKGRFICFVTLMGYDMIQRYLGSERLLMTMVTDPDWAKEMFMTHVKFLIEIYEFLIENGIKFDGAFIANDMGYRNDTLFSPQCYRELIFPADKMICSYFHDKGMPIILHSDGDLRKIVPDLIEAGFDCLQPIEVKAGMDLIELKKEYGDRLAFMGGIDTRLMSDNNPDKIEEEIRSKFEVVKKGGGYIYHSDHSVPDIVSFSQYKRVMELVKKYGKY